MVRMISTRAQQQQRQHHMAALVGARPGVTG
jgi:hypothetical protein